MRLFVALELPSAVRENLAALLKALRAVSPQTRWVRPENLHLTLKFMGEVPETKLAAIRSALAGVRSDQPTTVIPREQRPFAPHLTLARFEPPELPEKLRSAIQENAAREFGSFRTNQYLLIESKLKPSGAGYTTLESFPFAAAEA